MSLILLKNVKNVPSGFYATAAAAAAAAEAEAALFRACRVFLSGCGD
jgi:hypothetical protein